MLEAESVAAVETLRLGLLRLGQGLGEPGDLTEDLESVLALQHRIDELMAPAEAPTPI